MASSSVCKYLGNGIYSCGQWFINSRECGEMSVLFTEIVRAQTKPYWEGSFLHPFLTELQAGTLPMEKFRYYLIQDCYYLTHFARLYALVAERTAIAGDRDCANCLSLCVTHVSAISRGQ